MILLEIVGIVVVVVIVLAVIRFFDDMLQP